MHCFVYASQRKPDTYLWLGRRDRARAFGDADIEPVLLPQPHPLCREGEEVAALRDPGQRELYRLEGLRVDEARKRKVRGNACRGDARRLQQPAAGDWPIDTH